MQTPWSNLHTHYSKQDWINKPSIFAEFAMKYFPETGRVLDLGAGQGQDSKYFAENGYEVMCTDISAEALDLAKEKISESEAKTKVTFVQLDLNESIPYPNESFDVVYAHLAIQFFSDVRTKEIAAEIYKILKPGGVVALLCNSTSDPEYDQGEQIEADYFQIGDMKKRYYTPETLGRYFSEFEQIICDAEGETYKDAAKGVHNLIRFVGKKS